MNQSTDNVQSVRENSAINIVSLLDSKTFSSEAKNLIKEFIKSNLMKAQDQHDSHKTEKDH